jgi:hypothetical protein
MLNPNKKRKVYYAKSRSRLILHFDVNETIMVGDPASGLDFNSSLNCIVAKAAFVTNQMPSSPTKAAFYNYTWHDGSPFGTHAPALITRWRAEPPSSKPYFRVFRQKSRRFCDPGQPGHAYISIFNKLKQQLSTKPNPIFSPNGYHFLLPAFFHTLVELTKKCRDFSLIIRTYGSDLAKVTVLVPYHA